MPQKPPFRKINLLSRKAKDEKGLSSISGGGEYTIKSKNKIANPNNSSATLPRGSKVTVSTKSETVNRPGPAGPVTYRSETISVPKKTFVPGDMNPNVVKDRPTTNALGRSLRENPAKTSVRMDAQKKEQTSYDYNGKKEYSGRVVHSEVPKKINIPVPGKPTVKSEAISRNVTTVEKPVMHAGGGGGMSTKRNHVPWLDKKNETKAFTRKPNTGGKTKISWGKKVRWK